MIDSNEFLKLEKQFEAGAPVVEVDLEYFRSVWQKSSFRPHAKEHPNTAVGLSLLGIDDGVHTPEQAHAVWVRFMLLCALEERGVLENYQTGDELSEGVLAAAATIPCTRDDLAEAMILRHLQKASADEVAAFGQEAAVNGYDLGHPLIDAKFLDWVNQIKD